MSDPSMRPMAQSGQRLPSGTVTFFFTDIEGSTVLWENHPNEMRSALALHDSILRDSITANHGHVIKTTGDGIHAVFEKAVDAMRSTLEIQRKIQTISFFEDAELSLRVRMGLHTGEAELREGDYFGQSLNRAARIMSIGYGGQILLSSITAEVIREHLPQNTSLVDLGEHYLRNFNRPEHIYQLSAPDLPQDFPPIRSLPKYPSNLPAQLTSFIGREKEMVEIKTLLSSARLVTLTGSGGTGKSRLSVEIGREELASFPNGVWLIELAPLSDPAQILPALGQALGVQEHPYGPLTTMILDFLRDKKILLLLDNCEHLIESCAHLADDLLHQCAGLKILASSREALGIAGEVAYHTPSLADSESTRLFMERALAANPNFHMTGSNASSVTQICSRLDGIPLAIELAAARVKSLSPEQIASRLDDRFRLLVGGSRTALPRQQTLRALIDWSYDLLSEEEKGLFRLASVFVGGWTLDSLEAVTEDSNALEHLEQLVNKSLVTTEEHGSEMRYFMLETIRQYAREKLFEAKQSPAARDRHFFYFDHLTEFVWNVIDPENILAWRDQGEDEIENMRAAVEWGLGNYPETAIRLAANFCLATGWINSRREDGLSLCRSAIERVRSLPPEDATANIERQKLLAKALFAQGMVGMGTGNMPLVIRDLQDGIAAARSAGDKRMLGYNLELFYTAAQFISAPEADQAAQEGFEIFTKQVNDKWGFGMAYLNMTRIAGNRGDTIEQEKYFTIFKEHIKQAPHSLMAGLFYLGTGLNERIHGNFQSAKKYFEEGLIVFQNIRNWYFETIMRSELGHVARQTGNIVEARKIYIETLKRWQNLGNRGAVANQLECFAFLDIMEEEPQHAAILFGSAESLREKVQAQMTDYEQVEYDGFITKLHSMLPEAEIQVLWKKGESMTKEQTIQFALREED